MALRQMFNLVHEHFYSQAVFRTDGLYAAKHAYKHKRDVCCKIYSKILTVLFGFSQWPNHLPSVWGHIGTEYQKSCVTFVHILVYRCSKPHLYKYVYRLQHTQSQNRGQVKLMAGFGSAPAWFTSALTHMSRNSLYWLYLLWVIICFRGTKDRQKKR